MLAPLVRACEGVDLLIHECFPPAVALAAASGLSIERATIALNAAHTSPKAAGKVFQLVKPRLGAVWHTLLSPQVVAMLFSELGEVYAGPVVQTQDLTVINVTKEAVISRQAKVVDQLPPIAGQQRTGFKPVQIPPPPTGGRKRLSRLTEFGSDVPHLFRHVLSRISIVKTLRRRSDPVRG